MTVWHLSEQVQAELAAFDLAEKHGISLVSILPTLVFGPVLLDRPNRTGISIDSVKVGSHISIQVHAFYVVA